MAYIFHWPDSKTILKKPLVFAEFGKSKKDPGYSTSVRDSFLKTVYTSIYNLTAELYAHTNTLPAEVLETQQIKDSLGCG
ncbi:unnamed protein product [Dovyalis caffra]|uniref:Uncharacterized protein n=1 Tax=Dovyalis caffra TaxID=77055 RepID=A0AAV1S3U7_9ROSI|nr:unnamed protein product [Dovyalis caffra]